MSTGGVSMHPTEGINSMQTRRQVMVTNSVSPGTKTTRRKASVAPELTASSVIAVLKSARSLTAVTTSIDPEVRRRAGGGGGVFPRRAARICGGS